MRLHSLFDLSSRRALVTGGNSGIGEAMARALGLAGAAVTLVARRESELESSAQRLRNDAIAADFIACDLANVEELQACAVVALNRHGAIDILVNAWSPYGINCNAIGPGFFSTPLTAPLFTDPAHVARFAAQTAIGRNGELTDLYGATVFLASDAAAYITGQILYVDGGFTAK